MVVWLVVCGFRSLNVGGLDSGGLDSGGRKEMESYLLGRSPRTKPHQAAGEEEWKATSSGEALEQSQFKLQAKGNGKLLPRAEPSHKAIPSCKEPRCGGLLPRAEPSHKAIPSCKEPRCGGLLPRGDRLCFLNDKGFRSLRFSSFRFLRFLIS